MVPATRPAPSRPAIVPRPSLSPAHGVLLDTYLRALASRPALADDGPDRGRPDPDARLAELEAAFAAAYAQLRSSPDDPGEDAAFRAALLRL